VSLPRRPAACLAALAALAVLTACSASSSAHAGPKLKVAGAYVPQPAMADMAAGYFTVANTGGTDAKLTSVTSDIAKDVTMHSTEDNRMTEVGSFTVPAGGKLTLALGGNHLMLMDLTRKPVVGDKVSLELHFDKAGTIDVRAPVEPMSYRPKD
jgi:copper(I)-binding protein